MNKTLKNIALYAMGPIMAAMALTACNDLDTLPEDRYVTAGQKEESIEQNPELAKAGVVGIASTYNQLMTVYDLDFDFGWPSVMFMMDSGAVDMVSPNNGYNWFAYGAMYNWGTVNNPMTNMLWNYSYQVINSANTVLKNFSGEITDPELQLYAAQAHANRAYIYFTLAQMYQYTYKGHEDLPCVPLVTDTSIDTKRATVAEVYEQILDDLDKAIEYLTECGLGVDNIAQAGLTRFVSLGTAYGLRARVNLVMNKWTEAASDASQAITISGCTPYSIAQASKPAFNSESANNLMWCIFLQETDRVVTSVIANWGSHMGSLSYGYAFAGGSRMINSSLYATIPATDCRKGWWLDEDTSSPNVTPAQLNYIAASPGGARPYLQVKFGPYQDALGTSTNAAPVIMMRVEEMYLIKAEATAMAGGDGKSILEDFVKTYRDPSYTCSVSSGQAFQDEVWRQRRIEFWGEGLSYLDLLRLNKPLDRRGGGWPTDWVYNVEAPLKPLLIPNTEVQANPDLGSNNELWSRPNPVGDY